MMQRPFPRLAPLPLFLLLLLACGAAGPAATTQSAPEAALKAKGLTKVGNAFLLEADARLAEKLREMRASAAAVAADTAKRNQIDKDIRRASDAIVSALEQIRVLDAENIKKKDVVAYNDRASRVNALLAQVAEAERFRTGREEELKKLTDPRDAYMTTVIALADLMEATAGHYKTLADDPAVKSAIEQLNAKSTYKLRLGPSGAFAIELPNVRRERQAIDAAVVKFTLQFGVPHVDVTLNNSVHVAMVLDSGAATVLLTDATARQLGLPANGDGRKAKLGVADGRTVDANIVTLKSIRLAQFTVENVECAVLPPNVKGDNLLGGTFLRHFSYRMDLATNQVHMFQLTGKPAESAQATGGGSNSAPPPPASAPASQPASSQEPTLVTVPATRNERKPVDTGITLAKGDTFTLVPNLSDQWCGGGTHANQRCDFRGYPGHNGWMAMMWKVGSVSGLVTSNAPVTAAEPGPLLLFASDDRAADNDGSIRVSITVTRANAPAPTPAPHTDGAWTVLFKSDNPELWNTDTHGDAGYAVPLDRAPHSLRYLRIRNEAGRYAIIALTFDDLQKKAIGDSVGWEGTNYTGARSRHLGIIDKSFNRNYTNAIDVTQRPGAGWTGWGFGNLVNTGGQGYAWEGHPVPKAPFEFAVTSGDLTAAEHEHLVGN